MKATPGVSVIITTFNRAPLLMEAIASVRRQSFDDYELIVVDDGSTDDTAGLLASLSGQLHYLPIAHSGKPEVARNRGLALAQGKYIAFLDDDDQWPAHYLEQQAAALENDPSLGFAYTNIRYLYPDGAMGDPMMTAYHTDAAALPEHLLEGCFIYPSTFVMRRRLLEHVGLIDEHLSSQGDYAFILRLAHAAKAACLPDVWVTIRRGIPGLSHQREQLHYQNTIYVLEHFLASNHLTRPQRRRGRSTLSRFYTHVGLTLAENGSIATARHHFLRSLRLNPVQRRAWAALFNTFHA